MVIADGRLATIMRTTRVGPATTLLTDRLRPVQNNICTIFFPNDLNIPLQGAGRGGKGGPIDQK